MPFFELRKFPPFVLSAGFSSSSVLVALAVTSPPVERIPHAQFSRPKVERRQGKQKRRLVNQVHFIEIAAFKRRPLERLIARDDQPRVEGTLHLRKEISWLPSAGGRAQPSRHDDPRLGRVRGSTRGSDIRNLQIGGLRQSSNLPGLLWASLLLLQKEREKETTRRARGKRPLQIEICSPRLA